MDHSPPLLSMQRIAKSFPGVQALKDVSINVRRGEVHALLGENGAGKSTLMRILGGAEQADQGTILMEGQAVVFNSPQEARRAGIAVIYQELNLVPGLTPVENIFLGQERTTGGFIARRDERNRAQKLFEKLGAVIPLDTPCRRLTTAQHQLIEIAKALAFDAKILVMDEPTAALTAHEVDHLFSVIRDLQKQGIGIIYISHRLDEIEAIADHLTIIRDGCYVVDRRVKEISRHEMIEGMVGRPLTEEFPQRSATIGERCLEIENVNRGRLVRGVSFHVRHGEVLGLAGLVGAGRTELVRAIFGADRRDSGSIRMNGKLLPIRQPIDAIAAGIGLLTEDRKLQGLVLQHSVRDNFGLPNLARWSKWGFVNRRKEKEEFSRYAEQLRIRLSSPYQRAGELSGGNQQKVVLAKWLARHCDLFIFDEPTRGIDVGAKYEIYRLINDLAEQGKAIIMISSELPEMIGMVDRILVMHEGRVTGELSDARHRTQQEILELAVA